MNFWVGLLIITIWKLKTSISHPVSKASNDGAHPGDCPFHCVIRIKPDNDESFLLCEGVIIDKKWALTAAGCVDKYKSNPELVEVVAGIVSTEDVRSEPHMQKRKVSEINIHPSWSESEKKVGDLALVKVSRKFNENRFVKAARIGNNVTPNETVQLIGYGNSENLSSTKLVIASKEECLQKNDNPLELFCTKTNNSEVFNDNSFAGAPLVRMNAASVAEIHGILSAKRSHLFSNTTSYKQWIENTAEIDSKTESNSSSSHEKSSDGGGETDGPSSATTTTPKSNATSSEEDEEEIESSEEEGESQEHTTQPSEDIDEEEDDEDDSDETTTGQTNTTEELDETEETDEERSTEKSEESTEESESTETDEETTTTESSEESTESTEESEETTEIPKSTSTTTSSPASTTASASSTSTSPSTPMPSSSTISTSTTTSTASSSTTPSTTSASTTTSTSSTSTTPSSNPDDDYYYYEDDMNSTSTSPSSMNSSSTPPASTSSPSDTSKISEEYDDDDYPNSQNHLSDDVSDSDIEVNPRNSAGDSDAVTSNSAKLSKPSLISILASKANSLIDSMKRLKHFFTSA